MAAVGFDAIHAAMAAVHGEQEPRHWLLDPGFGLLGPRLESASAYDAGDHWHLVTVGLSNTWDAEGDSGVSGLGYEFSFRVRKRSARRRIRRASREDVPPWSVGLVQRLGDAALEGLRVLPGHTLDGGGSITGEDGGALVALGFVDDPVPSRIQTPNGTVSLIQAFGMTRPQLDRVLRGEADLRSFGGHDGLFVTDPFPDS